MHRGSDLEAQLAELDDVAGQHAGDTRETQGLHEALGTSRHDDGCAGREALERTRMQVVPVQMRDGDHVDTSVEIGHRIGPPQVSDATAQERIGDDARSVELEEDGAVPEPGQARR